MNILPISRLLIPLYSYRQVFLPSKKDSNMDPLGLHYCDSGALFTLLSTLANLECAKLHTKVNEYFYRTTGAVGLIFECLEISESIKLRAIGRVQLQEVLEFQPNYSLAQRMMENKGPTRFQKHELEGKLCCVLEKILKEEYNYKFVNSIFFPIEHPLEKSKYTNYVGLVNFKEFKDCDAIYNGLVTECLRHCFGMLRSASNYEEEKLNSNRCKAVLNTYMEILMSAGSKMVYEKIQEQSMNIFNATKCSVYLRDPEHCLVPKVLAGVRAAASETSETSEDNEESYYPTETPGHTTTARKVVETGRLINIEVVEDDPLYTPANIPLTDNCRSLLAFPIKLEGRLLGVIEVYDKNTPSLIFTEEDLKMTKPFATSVAFAMEANKNFYHFLDVRAKQKYLDCIFLRRVKVHDEYLINEVLNCRHKHNLSRVTDFRFDPSVLSEKHTLCVCLMIFEKSGLLKKYLIQRKTFVRFLVKVKEAHQQLPFHNWNNTFLSLHFVFVCVNQYNLIKERYITVFEYFTLLMAALCHSLDYRGPTTMFQKTTGTVLPSLFSSPGSINQLHQLSQALRLMTFPDCNILQHIDDIEFYSFASLLRDMIKGSNFALQPKLITEIEEVMNVGYEIDNENHRRLFHYLVLNCAQTCYACKPWLLCRQVGDECFQEFFRTGDLTYASGVFELPDLNEDILKFPEMNYHFIDTICLPNFKFLAHICPLVHLCVMKIYTNLECWKEEKEKIVATMAKGMTDDVDEEEEEDEF